MNRMSLPNRPAHIAVMLGWVLLLSFFFANIEIQIEGSAGWAANLPTWRIEHHWLLDIFWGGRAMTGYHAWVFPFILLFFHFPLFFAAHWSWRAECRIIACIMVFWVTEDFLWFVLNPAYGIAHFSATYIPWHKHWLWHAPVDYWIYTPIAVLLLWYSYRNADATDSSGIAALNEKD
jgi:hypothetical protein